MYKRGYAYATAVLFGFGWLVFILGVEMHAVPLVWAGVAVMFISYLVLERGHIKRN